MSDLGKYIKFDDPDIPIISSDFQFELLDGGTWCLVKYTGKGGDVVLPDDYEGTDYTIQNFNEIFKDVTITSLTINSNSLVNSDYFKDTNFENLIIGNKVTAIGDKAFASHHNLVRVTISDGVTTIGRSAFYDCNRLTNITIPDSVTSIGYMAFYGCSSLPSVTIGTSVTGIGQYAFENCDKLVEVINKSSLNISIGSRDNGYIGYYALNIKTNGESEIVNKDDYLFYTVNNINYLIGYIGNETSLVLPNDYNGENYIINGSAFLVMANLTSVTIPDCVTSIGSYAFRNCRSLTSVTIPDSVTSVGEYAFDGCSNLTNITIPDGITILYSNTFSNCSSITSITIPDRVTTIGNNVFSNCSRLTNIVIPNSVTNIGEYAFSNCKNISNVYYKGTIDEWNKTTFSNYKNYLTEATRYYYSDSEPTDTTVKYWHYVDDVVTV